MDPRKRKTEIENQLKGFSIKAKNGSITETEIKEAHGLLAELADVKAQVKKEDNSKSLMGAISALDPEGTNQTGTEGYLGDFAKQLALGIEAKVKETGKPYEVKSLLSEGSLNVGVSLFNSQPISDPIPVPSLFATTPVQTVKQEEYSYIRQVTRTSNAAVVAHGAVKPTSLYSWERVSGRLKVVAHVTEPIPEYWLKDHPQLKQWVQSEMIQGLMGAFEAEMLSGDGTEEHMTGLLTASGVQVQPYGTSKLASVRSAITKVELLGFVPDTILMHPLDWEAIETTTSSTGEFLLDNSPVDRSARRLWGVPVVPSLGLVPGQAAVTSKGAYGLALDPEFDFEWARVGDDFERNYIRARCESRADLMVLLPAGIVKVALEPEETP